MSQLQTYDNTQVRVNIGGFQVSRGAGASGYAAEGPFCDIEPDGAAFKRRMGQDGTWVRSKTNNRGLKVSIHTLSTNAPTNGFFSALIAADEIGPNGTSVVSAAVEDMSGTSLMISNEGWLETRPKFPLGAESVDLAWEFFFIFQVYIIGGN